MTCKNNFKSSSLKKRLFWGRDSRTSYKLFWGAFRETEKNRSSIDRKIPWDLSREIKICWMIFLRSRPLSKTGQRSFWGTPLAREKRNLKMKSKNKLKRARMIPSQIHLCPDFSENLTHRRALSLCNQKGWEKVRYRWVNQSKDSTILKYMAKTRGMDLRGLTFASILTVQWARTEKWRSRRGHWAIMRQREHFTTLKKPTRR